MAVGRQQANSIDILNGQLRELNKALGNDYCGCDGTCHVCKLDKAKPLVDTIMQTARTITSLQQQVETARGIRAITKSLGEIRQWGSGPLAFGRADQPDDLGERRLVEAIERQRAAHDFALRMLCDKRTGLNPSHPLCAGYCEAAQ
jgi:hypothetical protein